MKIAGFITLFIVLNCFSSLAQNESPLRIEFDRKSKRIELISGRKLPDYKLAKRGSIQFFLGRLDTPDDFLNFFHDGVRKVNIKDLKSIEKVQERFAVWRLTYKRGNKNTPRIHHLAVSFIPLSLSTKEPEKRVYLLLNDLKLIDWGDEKEKKPVNN